MDRRMCVFSTLSPNAGWKKTFLPGRPRTHQLSSDTKVHQLRAQRFKERSCWGRRGFGSCAQRREGRSSKGTPAPREMMWDQSFSGGNDCKNKKEKIFLARRVTRWNPWRPVQFSVVSHRFSQEKTWSVCHSTSELEHLEKWYCWANTQKLIPVY